MCSVLPSAVGSVFFRDVDQGHCPLLYVRMGVRQRPRKLLSFIVFPLFSSRGAGGVYIDASHIFLILQCLVIVN